MTTLDDLDLFTPTPATPNVGTRKCRRHDWEQTAAGMPWPARCLYCPLVTEDPDRYFMPSDTDPDMLSLEQTCVGTMGGLHVADPDVRCRRCPAIRDEATVRRNRNNRARGGAFERSVAKKLGGRRTGPLGGRDDVVVGEFAAVQTKKDTSLSLRKARVYLDDLARTFPGKVPLVVHAEPGGDRNAVVILPLSTWVDLHGPQDEGETA